MPRVRITPPRPSRPRIAGAHLRGEGQVGGRPEEGETPALRVIVQSLIALVMLAGAGVAYTHFYGAPFRAEAALVDAGMGSGARAAAGGGPEPADLRFRSRSPRSRWGRSSGGCRRWARCARPNPWYQARGRRPGRRDQFRGGQGGRARGRSLVRLDSSVNKAEIQAAQASLDLAKANFDRSSDLLKRGSGTPGQLRSDPLRRALARGALALARRGSRR